MLPRPSLSPCLPLFCHQQTPSCARRYHAENLLRHPVSTLRAKSLAHRRPTRCSRSARHDRVQRRASVQGCCTVTSKSDRSARAQHCMLTGCATPRVAIVRVRARAYKRGHRHVRTPARRARSAHRLEPSPHNVLMDIALPTAGCVLCLLDPASRSHPTQRAALIRTRWIPHFGRPCHAPFFAAAHACKAT